MHGLDYFSVSDPSNPSEGRASHHQNIQPFKKIFFNDLEQEKTSLRNLQPEAGDLS